MPWNLLLFPLLGGFQFIHVCHLFRYRSKRLESERLLLESASWGVVLLILGRSAAFYGSQFQYGKCFARFLSRFIPHAGELYLGTAIAALLIGWTGAHAINVVLGIAEKLPFGVKPLKLRIVERYDNGLLKLFYQAMYLEQPVSVTLSSRKIYIGYVADAPTESPHDSYFKLLLLLSGYRDEETMAMVQTVNYADKIVLGDDVEPLVFFVTLSMADVVSANFFDREIYQQHFANRQMISIAGS
jgi:hypothetical protein